MSQLFVRKYEENICCLIALSKKQLDLYTTQFSSYQAVYKAYLFITLFQKGQIEADVFLW